MKPDRHLEELARELEHELLPHQTADLLVRLEAHPIPEPDAAETAVLIDRLRPLVPRRRRERFRTHGLTREPLGVMLIRLAAQARLFGPVWWLGSLACVLLGVALAPYLQQVDLSLAALAPLLVITGVAYGFRSLQGAALELELACPVTPAQAMLGRILIMNAYYLALGVGMSLLSGGKVGGLLLSWTAMLCLFTGLMLTLTLRFGPVGAAAAALALWGLQLPLLGLEVGLFTADFTPLWWKAQVGALALGAVLIVRALTGVRPDRLLKQGGE